MTRIWAGISVLALASLHLSGAPILSIQPSSPTIFAGGTAVLSVAVSNAIDLYAYQFDVTFTPGVLSAQSVSEGAFLASAGTTFFIPGTIDNAVGMVTSISNTLIGPIAGANGSGTLTRLAISGVTPGTDTVALLNVTLLDSALAPIAANVQSTSVTVERIPEPGTVVLALAGLAAVCVLKRRA
jgi:hypothetical protein